MSGQLFNVIQFVSKGWSFMKLYYIQWGIYPQPDVQYIRRKIVGMCLITSQYMHKIKC